MPDQSFAAALAEARQTLAHEGTGYIPAWSELTVDERRRSTVEAAHWLTALARISEARTESGSRVTINDHVAHEGPADAGLARARVEYHEAKRREDPDWRGNAEALRRTCYVTPWEVVVSSGAIERRVEQRAEGASAPFADPVDPCASCGCYKSWHYEERGGYCVGDFMHCECRAYVAAVVDA